MEGRLERARILMDQDRYEDAKRELAGLMASDPDESFPHSLMALCHLNTGQRAEALKEAGRGIALEPDSSYAHYVQSAVYVDMGAAKKAEMAAREAVSLDPYFASGYAMLACAYGMQGQWRLSLKATDEGLAIDPDDASCLRFRAQALSMLGDRANARVAALRGVEEDPDSAAAHSDLGWVSLRQGKHREAVDHFRQALRLDPEDENARGGLLEALRYRFPLYRLVLQFEMWLARFTPGMRWGIIIGLYVIVRILRTVGKENPALLPFIVPIIVLYGIFIWTSWIGEPLVNITLLMHPLGRLALPRRERRETWVIVSFLVVALLGSAITLLGLINLWLAVALAAVAVVLISLATRIHSNDTVRSALFWGLTAVGALLVAAGLAVSLVPARG